MPMLIRTMQCDTVAMGLPLTFDHNMTPARKLKTVTSNRIKGCKEAVASDLQLKTEGGVKWGYDSP